MCEWADKLESSSNWKAGEALASSAIQSIINARGREKISRKRATQVLSEMMAKGRAVKVGNRYAKPNIFGAYLKRRWAEPVTDEFTPRYR